MLSPWTVTATCNVIDDLVREHLQVVPSALGAKLLQPLAANMICGDLCAHIAQNRLRQSHIRRNESENILVRLARLEELANRDAQSLFVIIPALRRRTSAADVDMMRTASGKADQSSPTK